uniref:Uncharacterized protein n=1 Tax=Parascaris equorum TaxID=6256 RepID=A0A914S4B1_PAREQ
MEVSSANFQMPKIFHVNWFRKDRNVVPKQGSLNLDGLDGIKVEELMSVPKTYWQDDAKEVGVDLPATIRAEMDAQEERIAGM